MDMNILRRLSSSDIKDKTELLKGRKDIEREMERFKVRGRDIRNGSRSDT